MTIEPTRQSSQIIPVWIETKIPSITYLCGLLLALILVSQINCNATRSKEILVYVVEPNRQEPNVKALAQRQPELLLNTADIRTVKVFQYSDDHFSIEVQLAERFNDSLTRLTAANIGKRLVFVSNGQILFAPFISEPVQRGKIVIELAPASKPEVENIARRLSKSFEFYGAKLSNGDLDSDWGKANHLRDRGQHDEAIQVLTRLLEESKNPNTRLALHNEIAVGYRLKENHHAAAETYKKLVSEPVSIDLDNYMIITQAYFYLSLFEEKQGNINLSESYFTKLIQTLEQVIRTFPLAYAAQWANLGIATFKLSKGDVKEARNRSMVATKGDLRGEAYLLLGLSYEYEKKFSEAKEVYNYLVKEHPDLRESKIASDFIRNLDKRTTNVKDIFKALSLENLP